MVTSEQLFDLLAATVRDNPSCGETAAAVADALGSTVNAERDLAGQAEGIKANREERDAVLAARAENVPDFRGTNGYN